MLELNQLSISNFSIKIFIVLKINYYQWYKMKLKIIWDNYFKNKESPPSTHTPKEEKNLDNYFKNNESPPSSTPSQKKYQLPIW